jgi:hypothetical protein
VDKMNKLKCRDKYWRNEMNEWTNPMRNAKGKM